MSIRPRSDRLAAWEKWAIALIFAGFLAFGAVVLQRSAFLQLRMTDAGVYFRAAWAVRSGADPYTIQDDRGWTYLYPPTLAVLLTPLADPPPGADRSLMLPYPASVAVWYALSLVFLATAAHWLGKAVEESCSDPGLPAIPTGGWTWWRHRLFPVVVCLPAVGSTLSRGQVNTLLLMTLAGMILCVVRAQRFRAGLWLAAAVALKVFPAYLLLYPLLRRDGRWVAGFASGLVLLLLVVPGVLVGPATAWGYNRAFVERMLLPHLGLGPEQQKVAELQRTMDSQSFMSVIHSTRNLAEVRAQDLNAPTGAERTVHIALALVMAAATVLAWWPGRKSGPRPAVLLLGLLACAMIASSAVCHLHYFILAIPLITGLLATALERSPTGRLRAWMWALTVLYVVGNTLPRLPGFDLGAMRLDLPVTRYLGVAMYTGLALWGLGAVVLWRLGRGTPPVRGPALPT